MKLMIFKTTVFFFVIFNPSAIAAPSVAVYGDSLATGGASHPGIYFEAARLWSVFRGQTVLRPESADLPEEWRPLNESVLAAPKRLDPTTLEYTGLVSWVGLNFLSRVGAAYLDTEEYAWPYLYARKIGVEPERILFAAQDGARAQAFSTQVGRVVAEGKEAFPRRHLVMFSGNDLCGPTLDYVTEAEEYANQIKLGIMKIVKNARRFEVNDSVIIDVMGHISVQQILDSPSILAKQIRAHGKILTCKELFAHESPVWELPPKLDQEASVVFNLMRFPTAPAFYCPTLFSRNLDFSGPEQIIFLAGRIRSYRNLTQAMITDLNKELSDGLAPNIMVRYVEGTEKLRLDGEDMAQDCFHLSPAGHAKVAQILNQSI